MKDILNQLINFKVSVINSDAKTFENLHEEYKFIIYSILMYFAFLSSYNSATMVVL